MKTLFIPLTLMRNSQKIKVNVTKILNYKSIILGSGSIMSLSERIEGSETVVVDESADEIDELIFKLGTRTKEVPIHHQANVVTYRFYG
jgi:hypothetical protein